MSKASSNGLETLLARTAHAMAASNLHPAWREFVRFCEELQFGEIENLKIQDGLPVLAEVTKKKVKFGS